MTVVDALDRSGPAPVAAVVEDVHRQVATLASGGEGTEPAAVRRLVVDRLPLAPAVAVDEIVRHVLARMEGLGPLDPLLADPAVTDVLVNGPGPVWVERAGVLERTDVVIDAPTAVALVQRALGPLGARLDRASPMVDARLADGTRLHAVLAPIAVDGPYVSLRRPSRATLPADRFATPEVAELVEAMVTERRWNLVVTGATGAGKTTLLAGLVAAVGPTERVVVLEEATELALAGHHLVRLEARRPNLEGVGAVSLRRLVREALRMRPDRLVVGEVRGPEAADLLQALSTGHTGSMSTLHASGPAEALRRLEALVLSASDAAPHEAIRGQVGSAVDAVVHLRRRGVRREIAEVAEVPDDGDPTAVRPLVIDGRVVADPERPAR